ncbi:alginate lyase family protein [Ferrimonas senticii]|uniref:alginate lyase family protein n=1 Tax=Ferrimonas senticii TaxID=394566 RepID=UPI000427D29B|nr:alginate lyase family protein [Ferrimonas senticii]
MAIGMALSASAWAAEGLPKTVFFDAELIAESKQRVQQQTASPEAMASYQKLLQEADEAMQVGLLAVTDKTLVPPSGDMHDYFSISPYWWPNKKTDDGLPWVRKDGKTNPDSKTDATDSRRIGLFTRSVRALALAYYFSGDEKYAEQASKMLRHWFFNPDTKMNPNLRYAQAVPGVDNQRRSGMIDSRSFSDRLVDALALLETSKAWTEQDDQQMRAWLGEFLDWLVTSEQGTAEMFSENNHGTWMQAQVAGIAYYLGREDLARSMVAKAKWRIRDQFKSDGSQPEELERTRGYWYSFFNLDALAYLAQLGDKLDVEIWEHQYKDRSMLKGVDLMASAMKPKEWKWRKKDRDIKKGRFQTFRMLSVYRKADLALGEPRYQATIDKIGFTDPKLDTKNLAQIWAERDVYLLYPRL